MWEGNFTLYSSHSIATVKLPSSKALNLQLLQWSSSADLYGWIKGCWVYLNKVVSHPSSVTPLALGFTPPVHAWRVHAPAHKPR